MEDDHFCKLEELLDVLQFVGSVVSLLLLFFFCFVKAQDLVFVVVLVEDLVSEKVLVLLFGFFN